MSLCTHRIILFLDEWLGIALCLYLWRTGDYVALAVVAPLFTLFVYVIGYRKYWRLERVHLRLLRRAAEKISNPNE